MDQCRVALVGSPNSGKTTLYNKLTQSNHKTVNYPGSTVDYHMGKIAKTHGPDVTLIDTPGIYSLSPKSSDEEVTLKLLYQDPAPNLVIATVEISQMARQLLLVRQLIEANFAVILAVTMSDQIQAQDVSLEPLREALGVPVVLLSSKTNQGVSNLLELVLKRTTLLPTAPRRAATWEEKDFETYVALNKEIVAQVFAKGIENKLAKTTLKLDRVLLHPILGSMIFCISMFLLFASVFWAATPLMDLVDAFFGYTANSIMSLEINPLLRDFLGNGIVASIGAVMVFVPQILILFLGMSLLESSGYLARACTLVDHILSRFGLNGRSFVPMLSGYACAIPAMMAARSMPSKKEKFLTLMILPLMSCSARLPVYALLLSFLFLGQPAYKPALALGGIYILSLLLGLLASWLLSIMLKTQHTSFLIQELPYYRMPQARAVLGQALSKTWSYVTKAGPVIFLFAVVFWIATTFPNTQEEDPVLQLQSSYAAKTGKIFEPLVQPMGGDWRTGTAMIAAFAAREVFVSALALVFQIADEDEASIQKGLLSKMETATNAKGEKLFTFASVMALIVFFMIALQCMTTVGVAVKEFGGWTWPLVQLFVYTGVAYFLSVGMFQLLKHI